MTAEIASLPTDHLAACAAGGLTFGFINSLHCVGMCGPLVAVSHSGARGGVAYHGMRTASYTLIGLVAGALGSAVGLDRIAPSGAVFALVLAGSIVLIAFGTRFDFGSLPGVGPVLRSARRRAAGLRPTARAAVLGSVTPLLPCGLLYAALVIAAATGSASGGGVAMAGFALGAVPALAFAQWNLGWVRSRLGAARFRTCTQALMLLAASMLAWRGYAQWSAGAPACCGTSMEERP